MNFNVETLPLDASNVIRAVKRKNVIAQNDYVILFNFQNKK